MRKVKYEDEIDKAFFWLCYRRLRSERKIPTQLKKLLIEPETGRCLVTTCGIYQYFFAKSEFISNEEFIINVNELYKFFSKITTGVYFLELTNNGLKVKALDPIGGAIVSLIKKANA